MRNYHSVEPIILSVPEEAEVLFRPLSKSWGATLIPSDSGEGSEGEPSDEGGAAVAAAALALVGLPVLFVLSNSLK